MADKRLKDGSAKKVLLEWPRRATKLWPPPGGVGAWIRAQPKDGSSTGPRLSAPGASLYKTQPDGLWVHFNGLTSCDVVAIEVCGSVSNLNDKRARYMPSASSLVLRVAKKWAEELVVSAGRNGALKSRRDLSGTLPSFADREVTVPVRHLRVLYALPNDDYKTWVPEHVPSGYEYFIPHSSLGSYASPKMQEFLRRMSIASQFYSLPKDVR